MSPIIGLTDSIRPSFPLIGKLRKGAARPAKGNAPGKDLDFFRFTSDNPAVVKAFTEHYGQEPREIPCYLPYASVEDNFATWKEAWVAGGLQHRCDGVTCIIWLTDKGTYSREPVPCPGGCDQVGRLNLILPDLVMAGFVGYVTVETHSINDILNLQASLEAAAQLAPRGDLRGIMWNLRRVPEKISTPTEKGGRARYEKWMLKLTPNAAWAQKQWAGSIPPPVQALPSTVDEDTGETVDADWTMEEVEEVDPPTTPAQPSHWTQQEQSRFRELVTFSKAMSGMGISRDELQRLIPEVKEPKTYGAYAVLGTVDEAVALVKERLEQELSKE